MYYDKFGHAQNTMACNRDVPQPYIVDERSGVTYICFYDTPLRAIHRITVSGTLTISEAAYGAWDERENLTYRCINYSLEG